MTKFTSKLEWSEMFPSIDPSFDRLTSLAHMFWDCHNNLWILFFRPFPKFGKKKTQIKSDLIMDPFGVRLAADRHTGQKYLFSDFNGTILWGWKQNTHIHSQPLPHLALIKDILGHLKHGGNKNSFKCNKKEKV